MQFGDVFQVGGTQLTRIDKEARRMVGQRRSIMLTVVTVVVAILFSGTLALAAAPECTLLDDPEVMAMISGAGETALMVKCGEIAPAEIPSTPPEPTEMPLAPGVESW